MKRRKFTAEFKRRVVLEALRGDETVRAIASRCGVHPNQLSKPKTESHDKSFWEVFVRPGGSRSDRELRRLVDRLYARIGDLTMEWAFSRKVWSAWVVREGEADLGGREPHAVAQVRTGRASCSSLYYEPRSHSHEATTTNR